MQCNSTRCNDGATRKAMPRIALLDYGLASALHLQLMRPLAFALKPAMLSLGQHLLRSCKDSAHCTRLYHAWTYWDMAWQLRSLYSSLIVLRPAKLAS